jgi:hypothetical protein
MVAKGLKVGEVFIDGGLTYEVLAVDKDGNYISKRTDKKAKPAETSEEEKPATKRTRRAKGE